VGQALLSIILQEELYMKLTGRQASTGIIRYYAPTIMTEVPK